MRFAPLPLFACLSLLTVAFVGCATPSQPEPAGLAGKTLLVRPYLIDGALRTQGIVNPKTAEDIAVLEVVPYVHVGNEVFWPIVPATGEATDSTDPESILKARMEGFDAQRETVIPLTGLRPHTRYRIVARAYDAQAALISTEDPGSYAEVSVLADNRPELPLTLPVTLIDTPFGATRSIALQLTGSDFFQLRATLYTVAGEDLVPVPNGSVVLTPEQASRRLTFTHLEAKTTYRLKLDALDGGFIVMATKLHDFPITNDDTPLHEDLPWAIPGNAP
jgi:hypothetical protein